nr:GAF domain-containing protein [Gammaproteobacteria bacterium]NIR95729.1 GAF domain-containing protein [Gammaproteobacteria bacterium]
MLVDKNLFFHQVTLALCSSLEVNTALHRCYLYLRTVLPVDTLIFGLFDANTSTINHIAQASQSGPGKGPEPIPLPAEPAAIFNNMMDIDRLVPDTKLDPLTAAVGPYVKNQGCSEIILPLRTDAGQIGYLVMQVKGLGLYNEEHLELMTSVREPLTIAMSNALRHQEIV